MWRWCNFLQTFAPPEKCPVHINMDETSIRLATTTQAGFLVEEARRRVRAAGGLRQPTAKREMRSMITQIVFIADNEEIQPHLPTMFLFSERIVTREQFDALRLALPPKVLLLRGGKGWMTTKLMCRALRVLAEALSPYRDTHHFTVSADTYRAHLGRAVWTTASRLNFHYHLIPAKMTWALQPCDTHVFATYKRAIEHEYQLRLARESPRERWPHALFHAVLAAFDRIVRRRTWQQAFHSNGLNGSQVGVSKRVLSLLQWQTVPDDVHEWPSFHDFCCVFPERTIVDIDAVFASLLHVPRLHSIPRARRMGYRHRAERSPIITRRAAAASASAEFLPERSDPSPWRPSAPPATPTAIASPSHRREPRGVRLGPRPSIPMSTKRKKS